MRSKCVLLMKAQDALLQPRERLLGDGVLVLLGLEVAAREQRDEVLQLAAPELRGERHAQHVGVGRVVDVVVDVLQPAHLRQELGGGEGLVALLDARQELRRHGEVAEVVDRLAQQVAAVGLVGGDLRHGEVGLGELGAGGVHADEDLGDRLDVEVVGQLDHADVVVDDLARASRAPSRRILRSAPGFFCGIVVGQLDQARRRARRPSATSSIQATSLRMAGLATSNRSSCG